jgi:disulfide bond formation protein DsbB
MAVDRNGATWNFIFAAWLIALASTLGALFIGEVMGRAPCNLCWFQRAFMFPLVLILGIGCYRSDATAWIYGLPTAIVGGLIAAFHSLLYFGVISKGIQPCGVDLSCSGSDMLLIGWVPIPALSLVSFVAIAGLLLFVRRRLMS